MRRNIGEHARTRMEAAIAYAHGRKDDARDLRRKADQLESARARERLGVNESSEVAWTERQNMQYWQRP